MSNTLYVQLSIVTFKGTPLPDTLSTVFFDWGIHHTNLYDVYDIRRVDFLDDARLDLLDAAYKSGKIVHWAADDGYSASTFNV